MNRDYLKAGAMVAALVTMAPAEYQLGLACGFGHLAAGLPASLDIYTLRAIRTGRDVPAVALVMIAVNAASHLIAARHLAVTWYLIVAVSALPVLVLVRVERLGKGLAGTETPEAEPAVSAMPDTAELVEVPAEPAPHPVTLERVEEKAAEDLDNIQPLTLGPLVPVAELLAGTSRDQAVSWRHEEDPAAPEPSAAQTEPGAEPAEPPTSSDQVPGTVFDADVATVREWLAANPELTGTAIGTKLGKSDSYGRRVRRAALLVGMVQR